MSCDLFIIAGEKSADLHAANLLTELKKHNPQLKIAGVAGPLMREHEMDCILPMEKFQVMGFIDVFWALPRLIRQFYFVISEIKRLKPKAVITIDYPGFNLRLLRHLQKIGVHAKRIHFICPSVWAWGKKRIPFMQDHLDLLLCILPFEKKLFSSKLCVEFVGHPLLERLQAHRYGELEWAKGKQVIALFPGSRKKEIIRNLPLTLEALREYRQAYQVAICVADESYRSLIEQILHEKQWSEENVKLVPSSESYELMRSAYCAIAKSGTVTLELALHKVPTVVIYAVSFLDKIIAYDILRIRLPFYCLVNIIAQAQVYPELMGPNLSVNKLKEAFRQLTELSVRKKMQEDCESVIHQLGQKRTSYEAATAIFKALEHPQ